MGFPGSSAAKESACNVGDLASIPGLRRSTGEGNGYPLQYSGLENSMDCTVHGVTKSQRRLSDFHFHFQDPLGPKQILQLPFSSSSHTQGSCYESSGFSFYWYIFLFLLLLRFKLLSVGGWPESRASASTRSNTSGTFRKTLMRPLPWGPWVGLRPPKVCSPGSHNLATCKLRPIWLGYPSYICYCNYAIPWNTT